MIRRLGKLVVGVVLILTALTAWTYVRFGSFALALDFMRGRRVVIRPTVYELEEAPPDGRGEIAVDIINLGTEPISVIGGTSTCSCAIAKGLPVEIPGGESRLVHIAVAFSAGEDFDQVVKFYTTAAENPEVPVRVVAKK